MRSASSWRRMRVERGIYLLPNGRYYVCARRAGRLPARTVGPDLPLARSARAALVTSIEASLEPASPRLRFDAVAGWWLERFEIKVAAGERHPRTLESHRYHLEHHLRPALAPRRLSALSVDDVAALLAALRAKGCSAKTTAGALATLHGILRYAVRHGWIVLDPIERLEPDERPRLTRRHQRVLVDFVVGLLHVRAQLSRAHRAEPARRVALKTAASRGRQRCRFRTTGGGR